RDGYRLLQVLPGQVLGAELRTTAPTSEEILEGAAKATSASEEVLEIEVAVGPDTEAARAGAKPCLGTRRLGLLGVGPVGPIPVVLCALLRIGEHLVRL